MDGPATHENETVSMALFLWIFLTHIGGRNLIDERDTTPCLSRPDGHQIWTNYYTRLLIFFKCFCRNILLLCNQCCRKGWFVKWLCFCKFQQLILEMIYMNSKTDQVNCPRPWKEITYCLNYLVKCRMQYFMLKFIS